MSDVKEYMTDKKMTHCSEGNRSQRVKTEGHGDSKNGEQFLNANDHMFRKNIGCYGKCGCTGILCLPKTPNVWIDVDEKALLDGAPRLTENSRLACVFGGYITFGEYKPYGIKEFLSDLLAGKFTASVVMDELEKKLTPFGDKSLAAGLDLYTGAELMLGAIVGGTVLVTTKKPSLAKRAGMAAVGTHGLLTFVNGVGEGLESAGLGEFDWDLEKKGFKAAFPQYGEMMYNAINFQNSVRGLAASGKLKDVLGLGKDANDLVSTINKKRAETESINGYQNVQKVQCDFTLNDIPRIYGY